MKGRLPLMLIAAAVLGVLSVFLRNLSLARFLRFSAYLLRDARYIFGTAALMIRLAAAFLRER
ncbi:MAG: hypothetical protein DRQ14_01730 [Candidatus Latescibacterota bacterium]|nr:MAG: hypothetical protein DRQ14_01730 [Candidatus Latescibacterota bacterium]